MWFFGWLLAVMVGFIKLCTSDKVEVCISYATIFIIAYTIEDKYCISSCSEPCSPQLSSEELIRIFRIKPQTLVVNEELNLRCELITALLSKKLLGKLFPFIPLYVAMILKEPLTCVGIGISSLVDFEKVSS